MLNLQLVSLSSQEESAVSAHKHVEPQVAKIQKSTRAKSPHKQRKTTDKKQLTKPHKPLVSASKPSQAKQETRQEPKQSKKQKTTPSHKSKELREPLSNTHKIGNNATGQWAFLKKLAC